MRKCIFQDDWLLIFLTAGQEPGQGFFVLSFFHYYLLLASTLFHEHSQLRAVSSRGAKKAFFGTCFWRIFFNIDNKVLEFWTLAE